MPNNDESRSRGVTSRRRRFLQGIGATGLTGVLAGCSDDEEGDPSGGEEEEEGDVDPAFFEVSSLDPESESVTEEEALDVTATVTNTGESDGTQTIELRAGGETLDGREITLDADESDTVSFEGIDAADLGPGEYSHGVHSDDDDETGSLVVEELEPAVFEIGGLEPGNATVGQGDTATLSATVENTGEAEGSRTVEITVEGDDEHETELTLDGGDSETVSTDLDTDGFEGEYDYEVTTGDDDASATLIIDLPPSYDVPYVEGGVADDPAFELLPAGATVADDAGDEYDADELSAEFHFGYDEENLYLHADVTDVDHHPGSGGDIWNGDGIQYAAGIDGTYGPEDGIAHVDGETETHRWIDGEGTEGVEAVDASTSRNDGADLTVYEATIPWDALFSEPMEATDSFRFSVLVNNDDDGSGRDSVLGWTLPGINDDKTYGALGTFELADPDASESELFVDDLDDLDELADDSDTDELGIDTQNVDLFERPDGTRDESRVNGSAGADEPGVVYRPGGDLLSASVEYHTYLDADESDIVIHESVDGGETWTERSFRPDAYGEINDDWGSQLLTMTFSEGVDSVRFTLIGDPVWTPQIGHVEIRHTG